jgi:hypothetical protein
MIGKSERAAFGSTMRIRGVSSAGRAPALQAGGHRFDPGTLHTRKARKRGPFVCVGGNAAGWGRPREFLSSLSRRVYPDSRRIDADWCNLA